MHSCVNKAHTVLGILYHCRLNNNIDKNPNSSSVLYNNVNICLVKYETKPHCRSPSCQHWLTLPTAQLGHLSICISCSYTLTLCNLLYLILALICHRCFITACSAALAELFFLLWSIENENDFWRQPDISIIQYSPKVSLHRREGTDWEHY